MYVHHLDKWVNVNGTGTKHGSDQCVIHLHIALNLWNVHDDKILWIFIVVAYLFSICINIARKNRSFNAPVQN